MTDVFISYKREQRERVERLVAVFSALKLQVWFDARLDSGMHFDAEIAQELSRAKAILVLWSPAAYGSEWVRGEAMKGLERKVLAAAFVEPTDLYPPFNTVHAESLSTFLAEGSEGRLDDPGLLRLLDRIGALTGRRGLAAFARARAVGTFEALKGWAAANIGDPLEQDAWDLAQDREIAAARQRVQQARDAAVRGAEPQRTTAPAPSQASTGAAWTSAPPESVQNASGTVAAQGLSAEGKALLAIVGLVAAVFALMIVIGRGPEETPVEETPPSTTETSADSGFATTIPPAPGAPAEIPVTDPSAPPTDAYYPAEAPK